MECSRGSVCSESSYSVTTMAKAAEWFLGVLQESLPIRIDSQVSSDGRLYARIYDSAGNLINRRG